MESTGKYIPPGVILNTFPHKQMENERILSSHFSPEISFWLGVNLFGLLIF